MADDIAVAIEESTPITVDIQGGIVQEPDLTLVAAEILGGHRLVSTDAAGKAHYTDITVAADVAALTGMTTGAAVAGASATVRTAGQIVEPSWAWTPGLPVFCGANAIPTQVCPATGHLVIIGVALSATALLLRIEKPIYR